MLPDSIERDILIQAPVDAVWRIVTEPDQIAQWFSDKAEVDLRPGGSGSLTFEQHGVIAPFVVEAVEPPHRFAWRWSHPEGSVPREGNSTLVEFLLRAEGDGTRLRIIESGIAALERTDAEKRDFFEDHGGGWTTCITSLGKYAPKAATAAPR